MSEASVYSLIGVTSITEKGKNPAFPHDFTNTTGFPYDLALSLFNDIVR
jgi:hypothetical protein